MAKLTGKRKRFAEEYAIDQNATKAALRAGYSERSAHVTGCRLLKDANIREALDNATARHAERCDVTIDSLTAEYEEARELAKASGQPAAMVSASTGKAKLHGLVTDKQQTEHSGYRS